MQIQIDWKLEVADPALSSFLPEFQKKRRTELEQMKKNLDGADFEALAKIAHNWKGFSRPYGYIGLEAMAKTLEQAAKAQDRAKCQELFAEIESYLAQKESRLSGSGPK